MHLGVCESPDDGALHTDELLECKLFDINRDSVSHCGGRMAFKSEQQMLWYAKLWPIGSEISSWWICCISVLILYLVNNSKMKLYPLYSTRSSIYSARQDCHLCVAKEFDPVDCLKIVKASGTFNCLGSRIQLSKTH